MRESETLKITMTLQRRLLLNLHDWRKALGMKMHLKTYFAYLCAVCLVAQSCLTLRSHGLYIARQPPLSIGFSRREYWSGLPFPAPGVWGTFQPCSDSYRHSWGMVAGYCRDQGTASHEGKVEMNPVPSGMHEMCCWYWLGDRGSWTRSCDRCEGSRDPAGWES